MRKKPESRTCLGCRTTLAKGELIRIVRTPDGNVIFDAEKKADGRGAYICPKTKCLSRVRRSGQIERSLGCHVPQSVYDEIGKEIG